MDSVERSSRSGPVAPRPRLATTGGSCANCSNDNGFSNANLWRPRPNLPDLSQPRHGNDISLDAQKRFHKDPDDPLFAADGSDDGEGHGATRMLKDPAVLIKLPLPPNVEIKGSADTTRNSSR
jgi:hypothetical protein